MQRCKLKFKSLDMLSGGRELIFWLLPLSITLRKYIDQYHLLYNKIICHLKKLLIGMTDLLSGLLIHSKEKTEKGIKRIDIAEE
jgi:hypothetical protein